MQKRERTRGREQGSTRKLWKNSQCNNIHNIPNGGGSNVALLFNIWSFFFIEDESIGRIHSRTHK